jgi:hypothetical protein
VFNLLRPKKIYWHWTLNEGHSFTKIWGSVSPTDLIENRNLSLYVYGRVFWRNMMKYKDSYRFIMNYNLPSSKVWSFLPLLRPLLSKRDNFLIGKYTYHIKILSWSQFQLEDWKLKEIWGNHWVVSILTLHFKSIISFSSGSQTLKNMIILYFVYIIRGEKFW